MYIFKSSPTLGTATIAPIGALAKIADLEIGRLGSCLPACLHSGGQQPLKNIHLVVFDSGCWQPLENIELVVFDSGCWQPFKNIHLVVFDSGCWRPLENIELVVFDSLC